MATRQLCVCLWIMIILQAVAFAAAQVPASPDDPFNPEEPPSPDPAASGRVRRAHATCYKTVTHVPRKCARQFIRAIFNGNSVMDFAITADCCHKLACVRETTCADVLVTVCPPPPRDLCPPPDAPPPPAMQRRVPPPAMIRVPPSATTTK